MKNLLSAAVVTVYAILAPGMSAAEILLKVTGAGQDRAFDLQSLMEMEKTEFTTTTIWTEGVQTFSGVSLEDFLSEVGVSEGVLEATAVNDYSVRIPASDAVEDGPIIAYARNGAPMSLRDKGPLWIVYPYDTKRQYQSEIIYARSIWQLDRLKITE